MKLLETCKLVARTDKIDRVVYVIEISMLIYASLALKLENHFHYTRNCKYGLNLRTGYIPV